MVVNAPFDDISPRCYRVSTCELGGDISVLEIGYNRVPPSSKQIMKRNVYILHYVIDGKGRLLNTDFDKNCGYVIAPNELEIITADPLTPYSSYWMIFQGTMAKDMLKKCGIAPHNGVFEFGHNERCAAILHEALFELSAENELEESCLMLSAFYRILAVHMSEKKELPATDALSAQKIKSYIDNNYHRHIELCELAHESGYTRNYLYKLFKREYGISPQEYLIDLRIEKAKMLLCDKTESFSVGEVASAVGFGDQLYFSRVFKSRVGRTPTAFRGARLLS